MLNNLPNFGMLHKQKTWNNFTSEPPSPTKRASSPDEVDNEPARKVQNVERVDSPCVSGISRATTSNEYFHERENDDSENEELSEGNNDTVETFSEISQNDLFKEFECESIHDYLNQELPDVASEGNISEANVQEESSQNNEAYESIDQVVSGKLSQSTIK